MNGEANGSAMAVAGNGAAVARKRVTVSNPQGLHMRPAAAFAQLARQFQSEVTVSLLDRQVNGKSPLDLLLLAAEPGTELEVMVCGADAERAVAQLAELLASPACDDD